MLSFVLEENGQESCPVEDLHVVEEALERLKIAPCSSLCLSREDGGYGGYGDFQKDEGAPIPYRTGTVTHLLSTNAGRPIALWVNGPMEGSIIGDFTTDELKQIIDSIYE